MSVNKISLALPNSDAEFILNEADERGDLGCVPERIGDWMPENYKAITGNQAAISKLNGNLVMPTAEVYLAFILDEIEVQSDEAHANGGNNEFADLCREHAEALMIVAKKMADIGIKPAKLPWVK